MNWFRFYTETIHDSKIRRLPTSQRWLWVAVLTMASQSPKPGHLLLSDPDSNGDVTLHDVTCNVTVTNDDLSDIAKIPIEDVELGMDTFVKQKMIHIEDGVYVVTNWGKRQYVSDSSKSRVKKHRDKKSKSNGDVTLQNRFSNDKVTPPDTDTDTDTDKEREIKKARSQIVTAYEQVCGPLQGEDNQLEFLLDYMEQGMELELIVHALRKSSTADYPAKYANKILYGYKRKGVLTLAQANEQEGVTYHYESHSRASPKNRGDGPKQNYTGFAGHVGRIPPRQD